MSDTSLAYFDAAREAIDKAASVDEVKAIRDKAEAIRAYARQTKQSLEIQNRAAEIKVRAERRGGELLREMPKAKGAQGQGRPRLGGDTMSPPKQPSPAAPTLKDMLGATTDAAAKKTAERWEKMASVPEEDFEEYIGETKARGGEITSSDVRKLARGEKPHVAANSGESEWYTPKEYIEAAREAMGSIDLDPASCDAANEVVDAERIYTEEDDGPAHPWHGNVWLNPPYSASLVARFSEAVCSKFETGEFIQAVVLVNNATETAWGQAMLERCSAACFPRGRIRFWSPSGVKGAPLQGQMILYFGANAERFRDRFSAIGVVMLRGSHGNT